MQKIEWKVSEGSEKRTEQENIRMREVEKNRWERMKNCREKVSNRDKCISHLKATRQVIVKCPSISSIHPATFLHLQTRHSRESSNMDIIKKVLFTPRKTANISFSRNHSSDASLFSDYDNSLSSGAERERKTGERIQSDRIILEM